MNVARNAETSPARSLNYPARLFRWFVRIQIAHAAWSLLSVAAVVGLGFLLDAFASCQGILVGLGAAFASQVLTAVLTARRVIRPVEGLIEKAHRMREFPVATDLECETKVAIDANGWSELESAVDRLGRDLRRKTIRLSREKTELRAIMSAASEAVLAVTSERLVLFFNPQFAYLFETSAAANLPVREFLSAPEILVVYDEVLDRGAPVRRDVTVPARDGRSERTFQLSIAPLRKKHNQEVYGAVGIFHDITELKKAERYRIDFVANVSHELRTPLTSVNGYLQTVLSDVEAGRFAEAKPFLEIVAGNVSRLKSLVEDLLDLSTLESGSELRRENIRLKDLTAHVLAQIPGASARVNVRHGVDELFADPKRVEQVLRNLVENAIRYVPEGRLIEVEWDQDEGGVTRLFVRDDGVGIPPEHHARLFERFYRVDESRARTAGGTGIGLSLVKHIMLRHGGRVFVRSEAGRGAEFTCEFPDAP